MKLNEHVKNVIEQGNIDVMNNTAKELLDKLDSIVDELIELKRKKDENFIRLGN